MCYFLKIDVYPLRVAGQRSRTFYPENPRRPRDISLTTFDIDGARPKKTKHKGVRHTDPLQPEYILPSCQENRPPTPRRFSGRHTNDISDIEYVLMCLIVFV